MRRFLLELAAFAAIQAVIAAAVWRLGGETKQPVRPDHYLLAAQDKYRRLEDKSRPRIILVGGSNLAFGIMSGQLAAHYDYTPVNLGLHAGTGLKLWLNMVQEHVRQGDLVLIVPEYRVMTDRRMFNGVEKQLDELVRVWPETERFLEPSALVRAKRFADERALGRLHDVVNAAWRRVWRQRRPAAPTTPASPDTVAAKSVYVRSGFNDYGDLTSHYGEPVNQARSKRLRFQFTEAASAYGIDYLNAFAQYCQKRGAQVFFAYSPVSEDSFADFRPAFEAWHRHLRDKLAFPVLHGPEVSVFPDELFFDTPSHLTGEGALRRTKMLVKALEPFLSGGQFTAAREDGRLAR
jgi:hypothetical protein